MRQTLAQPKIITVILILQFVPFALFPPKSYLATSQEWWLPILLAIMAMIGVYQLLVRKNPLPWPWYLLSFSQGFNIISRMMMVLPHAIMNVDGAQYFDWVYVSLTIVSMLCSVFFLWFAELPEVRVGVLQK